MNCQAAQEAILLSDDPARVAEQVDSDLARHLAGCAACQSFAARLARIESLAGSLPTAGSAQGKQALLDRARSEPTILNPRRRWYIGRPLASAIAAVLLLGIGLSAWIWNGFRQQNQPEAAVVEQLIDFDLALADDQAAPQQREQYYDTQAPRLRSAVQNARLSDEDRRLATNLLEHGSFLSHSNDPVERAERFCDLSDLLVARMGSAAAAGDEMAVQRFGGHYGRVQKGLGANLQRLKALAVVNPEANKQRIERLERLAKRQQDAENRLRKLAEKSPARAKRVLQRMIENAERQGRKPLVDPNFDPTAR
jgi:hypothetical protein